ncbi:MAG: phosphatase PAP2 family protein [Chloroflexota bacterium]
MDSLMTLGILIILFLQSLGSWSTAPMQFFTFLGSEEFYLFAAPALVWCVDVGIGLRAGIALMSSGVVNHLVKTALFQPRPYWIDARVIPLAAETSFGAPSGHAQNAVTVWGSLAYSARRRWAWAAALFLMLMIGVSRWFLGVHFPHDSLLGWLLGALLLWALVRFEQPVLRRLLHYPLAEQVGIVFGASLVIMLVGALVTLLQGGRTLSAEWAVLAARAPGGEPIAPLALSGLISNAAVFFGMAAGGLLLHHAGWMESRAPAWKLAARYVLGVLGVFALWFGLGAVFPRGETLLPFMLRFVRYALVGCWITYIAPVLFIRLGLATRCR